MERRGFGAGVCLAVAMAAGLLAQAPQKANRPELVIDGKGFSGGVNSLDFSPDNQLLAVGGEDKTVRIWEMETGELKWTLRGDRAEGPFGSILSVRFSPSGRELLVAVQTFHRGQSVRVYNTDDFSEIAGGLEGVGAGVLDMTFDRDLNVLATADGESRITFWDWNTRQAIRSVQVDIAPSGMNFLVPGILCYKDTSGAKGRVPGLAQGREGLRATIRKFASLLKLDDPDETAQQIGQLDLNAMDTFAATLSAYLFKLQDEARLPYSGLSATIWELRFDLMKLFAAGQGTRADGSSVFWAGVNADNESKWIAYYDKHPYIINALRSSRDGRLVATADRFGEVHVWNAQTGRQRYRFSGLASPVYNVAFDSSGKTLGFGTSPYGADRWGVNSYGRIHRSFGFEKRRLEDTIEFEADRMGLQKGNRELKLLPHDTVPNLRRMVVERDGDLETEFLAYDEPRCFSFLRTKNTGFGDLFVLGTAGGSMRCVDPRSGLERRIFLGHGSFVTSIADSPDGRFLVSSCTDGVIRVWSAENYKPLAMGDFQSLNGFILHLAPGGYTQQAGFQVGDRITSVDGHALGEVFDMLLSRNWPYQPGQKVEMAVERRDGTPFRAKLTLVPLCDYAEPLLNLFVARDGEWVVWTPQGYFDASLGGDRLIGWHVNQGPLKAARFYQVHQFRKEFYRPDLIDLVLEKGHVDPPGKVVVAEDDPAGKVIASRDDGPAVVVDLRKSDALQKREPPQVKIVRPRTEVRVGKPSVTVSIEITRTNDLPLKEITWLVGSRPQITKDLREDPTPEKKAVSLSEELTLLPGENQVSVIVSNEVSQSTPATLTVHYAPPKQEQTTILPDLYVLSIGIADYKNADFNLKFSHKDAEEFAAAWKKQEGHPYRKVETRVLTNRDATSGKILTEMEWLVRNTTQSDVAVLFFSSHGMRDTRNSYYLATHDIDPDNLRGTGVRWTEVTELLKDLKGKVLVFVDTCHSGGITGEGRKAIGADDPLRDLVSDDVGAVVFSSSLPREVSLEDPKWGHGAFTRALLDTFGDGKSDQDQDGYLSVTEMQFQVEQRVKQLTKGAQHPATQRSSSMPSFNFYGYPKRN